MAEEKEVVATEDTIEPSTMTDEQLDLLIKEDDAQTTEVTPPAKEAETKEESVTADESLTQQVEQKEAATEATGNAEWDTITDAAELKKILAAKEEALSKKDKVLADKELFNQHLANELGEARRVAFTPPPPTQQIAPLDPNEIAQLDPVTAVEVVLAHKEQVRMQEEARLVYVQSQNKSFITSKVPDFETHMDDIAAIAKEDGISGIAIANFKRNPWAESPMVLMNLAQRAVQRKAMNKMQTEIETLKKKPDEVLKKIGEAAKHKTLTSASGQGGGSKVPISNEQVHMLSDAELEAALKEAK